MHTCHSPCHHGSTSPSPLPLCCPHPPHCPSRPILHPPQPRTLPAHPFHPTSTLLLRPPPVHCHTRPILSRCCVLAMHLSCPTTLSLVPPTMLIQSMPGCCTLRQHRSIGESSPHCARDSLCSVSRPHYPFFPLLLTQHMPRCCGGFRV
jgi:hypothetical protein